jgi:hypothetical protein
MDEYHLIKDGYYYRENSAGYTDNINDAGIFTEEFAKEEEISTHGDVKALKIEIPTLRSEFYGFVRRVYLNDKSELYGYGEKRLRDDKKPSKGSRWMTPKELAEDIIHRHKIVFSKSKEGG